MRKGEVAALALSLSFSLSLSLERTSWLVREFDDLSWVDAGCYLGWRRGWTLSFGYRFAFRISKRKQFVFADLWWARSSGKWPFHAYLFASGTLAPDALPGEVFRNFDRYTFHCCARPLRVNYNAPHRLPGNYKRLSDRSTSNAFYLEFYSFELMRFINRNTTSLRRFRRLTVCKWILIWRSGNCLKVRSA